MKLEHRFEGLGWS